MLPEFANEADGPRLDYVTCLSPAGLHRMAYWEWGDPNNDKVLICVHGLTRSGRDFDRLARKLSTEYRVVCPDIVGRGQSSWLVNPAFYVIPQYVADMMPLIARLKPATLHWFGTSLGGLIGMSLASLPSSPISRLVLNDVGPRLNPEALERIGMYVGRAGEFATFDAALAYLSVVSAAFGPHSDEDWRELNRHIVRQADGGQGAWSLHYDPAIALAFKPMSPEVAATTEALLWHAYTSIGCSTLIVRGANSDLLSSQTASDMLARNPRARLVEIPGVGHAPTFVSPEQLNIAADFLLAGND
jgi:pimeloyl-ACP methyl ester carboxylesterase